MREHQAIRKVGEGWRLGGQKLQMGASCLMSNITHNGASMVGVGHKESQQLGLINP
jgi:hypothetical protein